MPIRVLIVDDSAVIRGLLSKAIATHPLIEVVATAANGVMAIDLARKEQPDVILLDIEMPVMDGMTALPELLKIRPGVKIIMASTLTQRNAEISFRALALGAADYAAKPSARVGNEAQLFHNELIEKIIALGGAKAGAFTIPPSPQQAAHSKPALRPIAKPLPAQNAPAPQMPLAPINLASPAKLTNQPIINVAIKALAIASSTGGPQALQTVFTNLKDRLMHVPIFITQHMPATFTTILAEHLAKASGRPCHEVQGGEVVEAGHIYLARGDWHMVPVKEESGQIKITINQNAAENFCRPAADPMLRGLSAIYGRHLLAVVLTGMGADGSPGCREVVANGGFVIAQDEATSVVYGMPKAVAEQKLCTAILPLPEIPAYLTRSIEGR